MPEIIPVTLPAMGESVTEGTVMEWRKQAGETVAEGEVVADVTTDKVDVEVSAPAGGVLSRIVAAAGETVAVGGTIAEITPGQVAADGGSPQTAAGATGANTETAEGTAEPSTPAPGTAPEAEASSPTAPTATTAPATAAAPATPATPATAGPSPTAPQPGPGNLEPGQPNGAPILSPPARRAAALAGLDPHQLRGTGPGGMVRPADVAAAAQRTESPTNGAAAAASPATPAPAPTQDATPAPAAAVESPAAPAPTAPAPQAPDAAPAPAPAAPAPQEVPLAGPALALATAMEQSLAIPTATSFRTIEVPVLGERRRQLNAALRQSGSDQKVSFTHLIGYAIALAARAQPSMTAHFERIDGTRPARVNPGVHLGLAVDTTRRDGSRFLVVPVIRDAADRDFAGFRTEYERLIGLARSGKLGADEMRGASIQLTNPGGLGTVASVPRLTAGTGTIVATGAIDYPAGLRRVESARLNELGITKVMTLTSTYDHRVIQGAESGEFLGRIEALLAGDAGFYEGVFQSLGLQLPALEQPAPPPVTEPVAPAAAEPLPTAADHELLAAVSAGMSLVKAYRSFGHLAAHLDPLGTEPPGDEAMDERRLGLTPQLMRLVPADVLRTYVEGDTLADIVPRLREVYCGTIAYQIEHLGSHEQRVWLREHIESGRHRIQLSPERRLQLLGRLTKVDAMERYLRRAFLGQKTFSIEGLDAMVPMLEELMNLVAVDSIDEVVMGMAHRGRLATIAHVANRPYESILVTFEKGEQRRSVGEAPNDPTGDVKYHLGATGTYQTDIGRPVTIHLLDNPSHLEQVDPIVEGWTRALQSRRDSPELVIDRRHAMPVLIHGDAAMTGQGVVAEVFNLQSLPGYAVSGTVHVIANNQIGFTSEPGEARSTRYASDIAKGFDVPVVHVNADDLDACIAAVRLAYEYLRTFRRDVVIDLIGYRRFGHNETDEPAYTQPLMYERIRRHPTAREIFVQRLIEDGLLTLEESAAQAEAAYARVQAAHHRVKESLAGLDAEFAESHHGTDVSDLEISTGVPAEVLLGITEQLARVPDGFTINPKLKRQLERRAEAVRAGEADWATAEALAFGSLVLSALPVRLTGQDTERGTFSQRHLVLHDPKTGATWCPTQHLQGARATLEVYNSPLSELGVLGFEYGYSAAAPDVLVVWEAQFGDFVNGAQIIVDQFISSGAAKWGTLSRLVLLLPHGYEGMGPEHSSARLERFLQLSANGNMRVAYPSTAAQYFHLLCMQARSPHPRPLVVMTPKSLLRSPSAASPLTELVEGRFHSVLDDPSIDDERRKTVTTLLLCTGKIFHDLNSSPLRAAAEKTAIARVEMLDPLPLDEIVALVRSYPALQQLYWVQEEPRNMGAWGHIQRPVGRTRPYEIPWDYIGRPRRASTSEGFHGAHEAEQERIIREALTAEQIPVEEARERARCGAAL